ncbi:MAG: DUF1054 domain-containing protein [Bacilli bacterium]
MITFSQQDFDTFAIPGFEERMDALKGNVSPKLQQLGDIWSAYLTENTGTPWFPHVAKHARRKVNPPKDTWVAFSTNKRGYKMEPHFQIGMWHDYLFIGFGIIYEAGDKPKFGAQLKRNVEAIHSSLPAGWEWMKDHTVPVYTPNAEMAADDVAVLFDRLENVKSAELFLVKRFNHKDVAQMTATDLSNVIEESFETLLRYRASFYA